MALGYDSFAATSTSQDQTVTQYFPFAPRPRAAFQFQPILDGQTSLGVVTWNISRQDWYVSVYDLSNNRIFTLPLVSSPDGAAVASVSWDGLRRRVVATTAAPHGIDVGTCAEMTFSGFSPAAYDATVLCDVLGPSVVAYPLADDPGAVVTLGTVGPDVDLCRGYFASRIVYRGSARRFEVTP